MSKPLVLISCPIDTYSGYGARSRDVVKAFMALEKYDVKILSQRWGNTSYGYLEDHGEDELIARIVQTVDRQPDIWVQITVPNEFQRQGKYNIGITAGIETTLCPKPWIDGLNRMDLNLVSSEHSKYVLQNSKWDEKNPQTGQIISQTALQKPIEVLFEGGDLDKYFVNKNEDFDLSSVKESFCFLYVGHWLQGNFKEDRKNVGYMIKTFLETFKDKPNGPALLLKTSHVGSSIIDREECLKKIDDIRATVKGKLPNVYLVHGEVTDQDINNLYNHPKVKAMVSLTKGEGFGRPLLEFSLVKKPIMVSGWSGHVDFLQPDKAIMIGGTLNKVHPSAQVKDIILPDAQWFQADDKAVSDAYKKIYDTRQYKKLLVNAKKLGFRNSKEFSMEAMTNLLRDLLDKNVPELPQQVELNLPKLDLPKLGQ